MTLDSQNCTLIYHSRRQVWKLRCLMFAILGFAGLMTWLAWDIFNSLGLNPADGYGGVLAPLSHRVWGGGVVLALGLLALVGIELFRRRYAGQIFLRADYPKGESGAGSALYIAHVGWLGWSGRQIELSNIDRVQEYEGLALNGAGYRATPFLAVYVERVWVPMVVDLQGEIIETGLFKKFLN